MRKQPGRTTETLTINGVSRRYELLIPRAHDGKKRLPLVVLLHGRGGSGKQVSRTNGFDEKAEREGFVLACPDALGATPTWNSGYTIGPLSKPEDVAFLKTLIATLEATLSLDADRLFVCGHSAGAMMSYRIGAEIPEKLAAIGVVAGSIGRTRFGSRFSIPKPKSPLSVIAFHGKKDPIVPYDDPAEFTPVAESIAFWVKANGCAPTPKTTTRAGDTVVDSRYSGGRNNTEVLLVTLNDGDHRWPGGALSRFQGRLFGGGGGGGGKSASPVDATDEIWAFFKSHPRRGG